MICKHVFYINCLLQKRERECGACYLQPNPADTLIQNQGCMNVYSCVWDGGGRYN